MYTVLYHLTLFVVVISRVCTCALHVKLELILSLLPGCMRRSNSGISLHILPYCYTLILPYEPLLHVVHVIQFVLLTFHVLILPFSHSFILPFCYGGVNATSQMNKYMYYHKSKQKYALIKNTVNAELYNSRVCVCVCVCVCQCCAMLLFNAAKCMQCFVYNTAVYQSSPPHTLE